MLKKYISLLKKIFEVLVFDFKENFITCITPVPSSKFVKSQVIVVSAHPEFPTVGVVDVGVIVLNDNTGKVQTSQLDVSAVRQEASVTGEITPP